MKPKIELYVDGQIIDLEDSQEIAQTFQINEFFNISDRQASFTNRFNIPATARNLQVFDHLGLVGSQTRFPYTLHGVYLTMDGIPLISDGTANLKKFKDAEGYELYIYSGVNSIFEQIGDKLLTDLDFSDLNHNFNLLNFTNSFANTEGYIYALFDSGKQPASGAIEADTVVPAVFLQTLWDKVFTQAGFTYSGDIFNETYFQSKLILPNNYSLNAVSNAVFPAPLLVSQSDTASNWAGVPEDIAFIASTDPFTLQISSELIRIPKTGVYNFNFDISFSFTDDNLLNEMRLFIKQNDPIGGVSVLSSYLINSKTYANTVDINQVFNDGADIFLTIESETGTVFTPTIPFSYLIDVTLTAEDTQQSLVDFNALFAEGLTQKEFIKDVLQRFGLLLKRTPNSNNYEFIELRKMLKDRANASDYSEKFNRRNSQIYSIDSIAQFNYFKYKYLEDVEAFADSFIYADIETIKDENDLIQSAMTASQRTSKRLTPDESRDLYQVPFFSLQSPGEYSTESPGTFIFDLVSENIDLDYTIQGVSETALYSGNVPFCDFSGLLFKKITKEFYSEYAAILNSPAREEIELHLNAVDVYMFDFFKLIYLAQLGHYYYVEKIKDFLPGRITKLEAVKVVDYQTGMTPEIGDQSVTIDEQTIYTFLIFDFDDGYLSPSGQGNPAFIRIESLPASGVLTLNGAAVSADQEILWTDITSGLFKYDGSGVSVTGSSLVDSFTFSIQDEGVYIWSNPATFTITIQDVS